MSEDRAFARRVRALLATWLALLVLLALTVTLARRHLGVGNVIASLGIAALKAALVGAVFMGLSRPDVLPRLVAALGAVALAVLAGLSATDLGVRTREPTAWQRPQHVAPRLEQVHRGASSP